MVDYRECFGEFRLAMNLRVVDSVAEVDPDVRALHVTRKTKSLERVSELRHLRVLGAHDIRDEQLRLLCKASQITHLALNAFGLTTIEPISALKKLEAMELTDNTKFRSLDGFESLSRLQVLLMENCPISVSLEPIAACHELRYLWLSSRYAKPMRIASLSPIANLTNLERLKLVNVRVEDKRLGALHGLQGLIEVDLPNFFSHEEFVALAAALPKATGSLRKWAAPQPRH